MKQNKAYNNYRESIYPKKSCGSCEFKFILFIDDKANYKCSYFTRGTSNISLDFVCDKFKKSYV
jgi:hypothetical protein